METPEQVREMVRGECTILRLADFVICPRDVRFINNEWIELRDAEVYAAGEFMNQGELDGEFYQRIVMHIPSGTAFGFIELPQ